MSVRRILEREARVAFSTRAQSRQFRTAKWVVIFIGGLTLWSTPYFWWVVVSAILIALALHGFWRYKTKNWTHPWGGWDDLESSRDKEP